MDDSRAPMAGGRALRIIRGLFLAAGIYGLLVLLPLYLRTPAGDGRQLQYYYGFAGAAGATQLMYLLIARDPRRFAPMIGVGLASKLSFIMPCALLFAGGRLGWDMLAFGLIDAALACGFAASWLWLRRHPA